MHQWSSRVGDTSNIWHRERNYSAPFWKCFFYSDRPDILQRITKSSIYAVERMGPILQISIFFQFSYHLWKYWLLWAIFLHPGWFCYLRLNVSIPYRIERKTLWVNFCNSTCFNSTVWMTKSRMNVNKNRNPSWRCFCLGRLEHI